MIGAFNRLQDSEVELLYRAPILVCILIAGADGEIDKKEIREAIRFAETKCTGSFSTVAQLFKEIATDFEDKLKIVAQGFPYESTQRNPLLVEELSQLNQLWPRLESGFAVEFYLALKDIATKIASSSGGVFGYNAVGSEEAQFIQLSMIHDPSKS